MNVQTPSRNSKRQKEIQNYPVKMEQKPGAIIIKGNCQGLGIVRSLARHDIPIYLLDRSICIARFSRYTSRFLKCPDVKQETLFLEFLLDLAIKENLKGWLIYPNDDEAVHFLSCQKEILENYYRVTTPYWATVKYAYDKRLTYSLAEQCGIAIPRTWHPQSIDDLKELEIDFPVIIKPSVKDPFFGITGEKAIRANDQKELIDIYTKAIKIIDKSQTIIIQEIIPGGPRSLYSVGSLFKNGDFLAKIVAKRPRQHPMDFGHASTYVEAVDIPELEEAAGKILRAIDYNGLSEIEFMLDPRDGRYKLLEINARAWGWHSLGTSAGVDFPYLLYLDMLGENVENEGFTKGMKWIHLATDIPTALVEIIKGRMKPVEYIRSLRGMKQDAVFALEDPIPFIAELSTLPYYWIKRLIK